MTKRNYVPLKKKLAPEVCKEKENNGSNASHCKQNVPPQFLADDLICLPSSIDLCQKKTIIINSKQMSGPTLTKENAVESPDWLSTFSTALLAGTCSSGPPN